MKKTIPDLYVYKQDRKTCLGVVRNILEFTEDIRFNAHSEITFKVPEKYYDINDEQWKQNPVYDQLEKHRLLFFADTKSYFEYPVRAIGDSQFYKYKSTLAYRSGHMRYNQNNSLDGFTVQPETLLFDVGTASGYSFKHFAEIETDETLEGFFGSVRDYSSLQQNWNAENQNPKLALDVFIPVEANDVIAVNTSVKQSGKPVCLWRVAAYTRDDAASYVGYWSNDDSDTNIIKRIPVSELVPNVDFDGGFIRCWYVNSVGEPYDDDDGSSWYDVNGHRYKWTYPVSGFVNVFSGERRCASIQNSDTTGTTQSKMQWFQIVSIEESDDGFVRTKQVTAYSYEYSLHSSLFSVSETTLPFYIPDAITDLVCGDTWICDYDSVNNVDVVDVRSPQKMSRGILNEILDYLPDWHVKYVSSSLMTTYRKVEDADNIDIYSYLMDTIQQLYNCFIVFDNNDMSISAYSLSDITDPSVMMSPLHLTWNNAIQSFEKENVDASYYSALMVKAGDETYGIGLVNPTANNMIYNFDRLLPELNYCIPGDNRTLADAVATWVTKYNTERTSGSEYLTAAQDLVQDIMDMTKAESDIKLALGDYLAKGDAINVALTDDCNTLHIFDADTLTKIWICETPRTVETIRDGLAAGGSGQYPNAIQQCHNATMQSELAGCAQAYWDSRAAYDKAKSAVRSVDGYDGYDAAQEKRRAIARLLTLDYNEALKANNNDPFAYSSSTTLLSATEIKELKKYIVEGVWSFEDIGFSETYNVDDIIQTLSEVLVEAQNDLAKRLSIANFDFSITSANIAAIPGFEPVWPNVMLGHQPVLDISASEVITPMLLEVHINHKDDNDFKLTFTTDMRRKPMQFRFADLYSTISQVSCSSENSFTFDT